MARTKYKWRIAGFIFKAFCATVIAAIVILLLWRMIDNNNDPKEMDTVIANSLLVDAYNEKGESLNTYYQEQTRYTRGEKNYGYFAITQSLIILIIVSISSEQFLSSHSIMIANTPVR